MKVVARKLLRHLTPKDSLGYNGDGQFIIALVNRHQDKIATDVESLRGFIDNGPIVIGNSKYGESVITHSYPVTLSFGSATALLKQQSGHADLLKQAQAALARAKNAGGNKVVYIDNI